MCAGRILATSLQLCLASFSLVGLIYKVVGRCIILLLRLKNSLHVPENCYDGTLEKPVLKSGVQEVSHYSS